jgi:ABC-type antimicrobial peptide transport system permease subunit
VIRFVVLRGLWLIGVGLLIGLPASFAAAPLISSQLVGVTTRDPATYAATVAALLGTGIAAALIPAWRAARVDPKIAFAEVT